MQNYFLQFISKALYSTMLIHLKGALSSYQQEMKKKEKEKNESMITFAQR